MLLFKINSQEQFDEYIRNLPLDQKCHFTISKGIDLCDCQFKCRFQGKDRFRIRTIRRKECTRDRAIEIMRMF